MTPASTTQQIVDLISKLVRASLVDHQNYPTSREFGGVFEIGISGSPDLSASMKDVPYDGIYEELLASGAYHLRMIDGALVQLLYRFSGRRVISHRLCFFPAPALPTYDEAAELYEEEELFADIFSSSSVRTPIRIDYDCSTHIFVDVDHPFTHLTIGQYKGCRIPLNGPMTPLRFMRFILRNFYNSVYSLVDFDDDASRSSFHETITPRERNILHITG